MLAAMPMLSVTAKPFTGPVPNKNRTTDVIRVVRFESKIVTNAFENPYQLQSEGFFRCGFPPLSFRI